jgi:Xaa-Pro aminopeptidase
VRRAVMPTLVQEKVKQALKLLDEFDVDCWITFVRESELCGDPTLDLIVGSSVTWHSAFILTRAGRSYAVVGNYDAETIIDTASYDEVIPYVKAFTEPFREIMNRIAPKTIALNYSKNSEISDGLTHGMFLTMREQLNEIGLADYIVSAEPIVSALRQRKTSQELHLIRSAIFETEEIFRSVSTVIRPGITEKEIAQHMHGEVENRRLGFSWNPSSCPAVFTGPDTEGGHYSPSHRQVEPGHLIAIDFGVRIGGYCSDMQRTFYVMTADETTPPDAVQKGFETVVLAIERARAAMRPGVTGQSVDAVARNFIINRGYPELKSALGHQVGRFAHDGTALLGPPWEKYGEKPSHVLEPGMVFTLEPRVFVSEHGIASIEEMVVVTEDGATFLTTPQTRLILIDSRQMHS